MRHGPARSIRLSRREFARALRLGLGRARIDVRRHGLLGREDLLVAVCLRNPTRDPQVEGGLADWLLAIARDGGATTAVRRAVVAAASRPIVGRHVRSQVASILARLAQDGDRRAGAALLRAIDAQAPCDRVAAGAVWALGERAWRRVIRSYGRRWDEARDIDWGWIVHVARGEMGARRMRALLHAEVASDSRLVPVAARVVEEVRRDRGPRHPERVVDASLDGLERLVRSRGPKWATSPFTRWNEQATESDRQEAWRRLLAETDTRRLRRRLRAWWSWQPGPPTLAPRLFELARHDDRFVRRRAAHLLGRVRDRRIRDLALQMLRDDPVRALDGCVLDLLERNAADEDAAVVDAALPRTAGREVAHSWVMGVTRLFDPLDPGAEERPTRPVAWTQLLVRAIEASPCRHCRGVALRLLIDRNAATDPMLREALFDADDPTRRLARAELRKRRATPAPAPAGSRGRP